MRSVAGLLLLALLGSPLAAGEPVLVSGPRELHLADVGKVFVKIDEQPHPNFGHYLVLTSIDSLYGFDTFNLLDGKPTGRLHVSHAASPRFREVAIDHGTMSRVWIALREADEQNEREMAEWRQTLPGGDRNAASPGPATTAVELGDVDPYARMIARPNPDRLVLQFNSALVAELMLAERKAGRPLTRQQVERIRDEKLVSAVLPEAMARLRADRGYEDLDPARVWDHWQKVRLELLR